MKTESKSIAETACLLTWKSSKSRLNHKKKRAAELAGTVAGLVKVVTVCTAIMPEKEAGGAASMCGKGYENHKEEYRRGRLFADIAVGLGSQ